MYFSNENWILIEENRIKTRSLKYNIQIVSERVQLQRFVVHFFYITITFGY